MKKTTALAFVALLALLAVAIFIYIKPQITGKAIVGTRLVISVASPSSCNFTMYQGWNLVSFPCLGLDLDQDEFFENFSFVDIRTYDVSDSSDPWKAYNPNLPSYVIQDLSTVSRSKGYWINAANETRFYRVGELIKPTFIDLEHGWNLIGMPNKTISDTYNAFEQLIPQFDYVFIYNASDADWKQWTWNSSLASDQGMNKTLYNYGYWIYMLNDSTYSIR